MIQITAYLRTEEDLVKWKALENKTEWLHQTLNASPAMAGLQGNMPWADNPNTKDATDIVRPGRPLQVNPKSFAGTDYPLESHYAGEELHGQQIDIPGPEPVITPPEDVA